MAKHLDKETCRRICAQYESKSGLLYGEPEHNLPPYPYLHHKCSKNGWLDEFFHDKRHDKPSKYTFEFCHELAAKCKNRSDFAKLVGCRYSKIYADGWLDIFAAEFNWMNKSESMSERLRKYSNDVIYDAAKKYTKLADFKAKDVNMYNRAVKRHLLHQFTWLQRNDGVKDCFADNIYVYEFADTKVAYVGRTVNPKQRDADHHKEGDSVYEYAIHSNSDIPCVKYIYNNIKVAQGQILEDAVMQQYKDAGWQLLNKQKGGGCGNLFRISKTKLMKTAHKYEFFRDLYLNDRPTYDALAKYGWLCECTWLKYMKAMPGIWDDKEKCKMEASKYNGREAFRIGSSTAFKTAWRNGWIDEWFPIKLNAGKEIEQFDLVTGQRIALFESIAAASRALGIGRSLITACCHGRNQSTEGWGFRFANPTQQLSADERETARKQRNEKQRNRIKKLKAAGWKRITDPITKKRNWVSPDKQD